MGIIIDQEIEEKDLVKLLKQNPSICSKYKLTEDFIESNIRELPMNSICETQELSEIFIYRNEESIEFDKLNEKTLKKMSGAFFDKYINDLNWNYISLLHRDLTLDKEVEFIEKYADRLNWNYITYMDLTASFIIKFNDRLDMKILSLIENPNNLYEKSKIAGEKLEEKQYTKNPSMTSWKDIIKGTDLEKVIGEPKVNEVLENKTNTKIDSELMKVDNLYVDADGQLHAKIGNQVIKIKLS